MGEISVETIAAAVGLSVEDVELLRKEVVH